MRDFRLFYFSGRSDHITRSEAFAAPDDLQAIRVAEDRRWPGAMELWSEGHKIKRWDREPAAGEI